MDRPGKLPEPCYSELTVEYVWTHTQLSTHSTSGRNANTVSTGRKQNFPHHVQDAAANHLQNVGAAMGSLARSLMDEAGPSQRPEVSLAGSDAER